MRLRIALVLVVAMREEMVGLAYRLIWVQGGSICIMEGFDGLGIGREIGRGGTMMGVARGVLSFLTILLFWWFWGCPLLRGRCICFFG